MQHGHILKIIILASAQSPKATKGAGPRPSSEPGSCLIYLISILPLSACRMSVKIDNLGWLNCNHCSAYIQALGNHGL